jgi:hypothetical protein
MPKQLAPSPLAGQSLIAAFDVASGTVQGIVGDTRTEAGYVNFLETLFTSSSATTPLARISHTDASP